jgi:hypothetical protein
MHHIYAVAVQVTVRLYVDALQYVIPSDSQLTDVHTYISYVYYAFSGSYWKFKHAGLQSHVVLLLCTHLHGCLCVAKCCRMKSHFILKLTCCSRCCCSN